MLHWSRKYNEVVWLDSNNSWNQDSRFDAILAVDAFTALRTSAEGAFDQLNEYQLASSDWIFGYLSYDLKNDLENLESRNPDLLEFPDLYFFQPKKLFFLGKEELEVSYLRLVEDEMEEDLREISQDPGESETYESSQIRVTSRISEAEYLDKTRKMLEHIHRGDIYEACFCQEFFAEDSVIEPLQVYNKLNKESRPPFAAYLRLYDQYLMSASPERFLQKRENQLISQPIKGTAPRSEDSSEDEELLQNLKKDPKERSENIMIVDLVRNDLSRTAKKGSVKVRELCGIYSFNQVHQMISTVVAELEAGIPPVEALKTSFPMGSMTGAPKISAMQLIDELEVNSRGLYSGSVGYFSPEGDFDFNVVIRSILYNHDKKYVSFSAGSAITAKSVPEQEYQECLLKARVLHKVLEGS